MPQDILTLLILHLVVVTFASGKFRFGQVAICIPVIFMLTGILTSEEAWAGFSNTGVIIFVPLFTLGAILRKSSCLYHLKNFARRLGQSRGGEIKIFAVFALIAVLLTNFMNATAAVTMMIPLIAAASKEVNVDRRALNKFSSDIASTTRFVLPLGSTLGQYLTYNAILEAAGAEQRFGIFDVLIMKTPICLAWVLVLIFVGRKFYKLNYKNPDPYKLEVLADESGNELPTTLSPAKDKLAYVLFFGGMLLMVAGTMTTKIPIIIWAFLPAIIGVYAGIITYKDAINAMDWDTILLVAGTMPLTTAITKTGADAYIAGACRALLFGNTSLIAVGAVMFLMPLIVTQFMSDTATANIFQALGVAIGMQVGIDPRILICAANIAGLASMATPMASGQAALSYNTGGYTMGEYCKTSLISLFALFIIYMLWMPIAVGFFA